MTVVEGGVEEQTKQVLKNLEAVVKAAGSSKDKVIKVTVFLKSMNDFVAVNKLYEEVSCVLGGGQVHASKGRRSEGRRAERACTRYGEAARHQFWEL